MEAGCHARSATPNPLRVEAPCQTPDPEAGCGAPASGRIGLTFTRPLAIPGGVTLRAEPTVPVALVAWDGGQGETGRRRSVSPWLDFQLKEDIP